MSIWLQMQNFVNKHESKQEYPPIYCLVRKYASQRPEHVLYSCNQNSQICVAKERWLFTKQTVKLSFYSMNGCILTVTDSCFMTVESVPKYDIVVCRIHCEICKYNRKYKALYNKYLNDKTRSKNYRKTLNRLKIFEKKSHYNTINYLKKQEKIQKLCGVFQTH